MGIKYIHEDSCLSVDICSLCAPNQTVQDASSQRANQAKHGVNSDIWLQLGPSWTLQPQVVVGQEPGAA